jgi:Bacterial Ig domain
MHLKRAAIVAFLWLLALVPAYAQQKSILFDAKHAQTAGNADWTLDEDSCGIAQRYPTPDQAGITSSTAETYWSGAFSAMGVDLVKKGFHVESLPTTARISYGDTTNAQDLKNYNVFVIPEPNVAFTSAEITAIRSFVQNGGGLFMIADHAGADRNSDGIDAAGVFNQLMGSPSIFGIVYNDNSADKTFGWFDNHPDDNYTSDTTSPIIWTGTFGIPSSGRGLGLFGSTSMTLSGAAKGHVWKTGVSNTSTSGVTFATSTYGTGRVAAVGDSSTGEDATNGCGHTTYLGYNDPSYDNGLIYANAVAWLANGGGSGGGDTTAPATSITAPANGATVSGTVSVTASASDNVGVTKVEFYLDGALRTTDTTSPYSWSWDTTTFANSAHSLVAKAYDAAGNVGTSATVTVTVSNSTGSTQLLGNPGFESGAVTWTASSGVIDNSTGEAAHSGSWKAWMDGYGSAHTDTLMQQVAIPSGKTSATLTFWLHIDTAETTTTTAYDTLKVQIRNSSGTVLATLATYSNLNANTGYAQKSFSLNSYIGQTIQVYLVGTEDASLQTSFVVDDFALNVN